MQQMKCKCVQTQLDAIVTLIFVEVKCLQALIQPYASNSGEVLLITLRRPSRPDPTPLPPALHYCKSYRTCLNFTVHKSRFTL